MGGSSSVCWKLGWTMSFIVSSLCGICRDNEG
jgi:hypothetical protein